MSIDRISTHVLDTGLGVPAVGVPVVLHRLDPDGAGTELGAGITDVDGRVARLNDGPVEPGDYRFDFSTADYFQAAHGVVFYPRITITVTLPDTRDHFHVPVLAGTYSYSTYLGS